MIYEEIRIRFCLCTGKYGPKKARISPSAYRNNPNYELQIPNSLGDKFSHRDSQNETLITHYEKKKTEITLNLSYFEKIMSH